MKNTQRNTREMNMSCKNFPIKYINSFKLFYSVIMRIKYFRRSVLQFVLRFKRLQSVEVRLSRFIPASTILKSHLQANVGEEKEWVACEYCEGKPLFLFSFFVW